ncbi:short coiled-coil protein isoform X2 [Passer montanus]|uniref:short coiled-coil protein isoform X2 n=1 Tax=Passer montanus TaxID=9160 RepID=UPI00195FB4E1|nr:short coiled-coil protein isoform X2 [Passer montanus]
MELPLDEEDGTFTNISLADDSEYRSRKLSSKVERTPTTMMNADMDAVEAENQVELEEKTRLINQVLELQHTLEDWDLGNTRSLHLVAAAAIPSAGGSDSRATTPRRDFLTLSSFSEQ